MNRRIAIAVLIFAAALCLGSCSTGGPDMDVTLSPANGTIDQALDVGVTAVFAEDVTEPPNWMTAFFLKKNNSGDTLCTAVNFTPDNKTATCVHDPLEPSTSYTATLTGVIAVNGKVATWTTVAAAAQTVEGLDNATEEVEEEPAESDEGEAAEDAK